MAILGIARRQVVLIRSMLFAVVIATTASAQTTLATDTDAVAPCRVDSVSCGATEKASPNQLPTTAVVDSFVRKTYGYEQSLSYKVLGIKWSADLPNVPLVVLSIGSPARTEQLFIMPDKRHAIIGTVVPFGPDPFLYDRTVLAERANGPSKGPVKSNLVLVEFGDLECPPCKQVQPLIERTLAAFPSARFIFQSFPLPFHKWAYRAAQYGQCIAENSQENFFRFVDSVYTDQGSISISDPEPQLRAIADRIGVDGSDLSNCLKDESSSQKVQQSIQLGRDLGVWATPTLFINGRRLLPGGMSFESLSSIVRFEESQVHSNSR